MVDRPPFSLGQIAALLIGIGFVILGGITLARAGLSDLTAHVEVMGLHHTPVLGFIELAFGVLMLTAATPYGPQRGMMTFLGGLALGFGIVVMAEPSTFHGALGVHQSNGLLYTIVGVIALLVALAAPVIIGRDRVFHYQH